MDFILTGNLAKRIVGLHIFLTLPMLSFLGKGDVVSIERRKQILLIWKEKTHTNRQPFFRAILVLSWQAFDDVALLRRTSCFGQRDFRLVHVPSHAALIEEKNQKNASE